MSRSLPTNFRFRNTSNSTPSGLPSHACGDTVDHHHPPPRQLMPGRGWWSVILWDPLLAEAGMLEAFGEKKVKKIQVPGGNFHG